MQKAVFLEVATALKSEVDSEIPNATELRSFWIRLTDLESELYNSPKAPLSDWLIMAGALIRILNSFSAYCEKRYSEYAEPALTRAVHVQHDWMRARLKVQPEEDESEP